MENPLETMAQLVRRTGNRKLGPIAASMTEPASCPPDCALLLARVCYALSGPASWAWKKVRERGCPWPEFVAQVRALADGTMLRVNVSGDLVADSDGRINLEALGMLVEACSGRLRAFTYTHHSVLGPVGEHNADAIAKANKAGFVINLSANSPAQADQLLAKFNGALPVTTLIPAGTPKSSRTAAGFTVIQCPSQYSELTCKDCQLCAKPRPFAIGFAPHGNARTAGEAIASSAA